MQVQQKWAHNRNPGSVRVSDCSQMGCSCIENEQLFKQRSHCLHLMRWAFVLLLGDDPFDQGHGDMHKHIQIYKCY